LIHDASLQSTVVDRANNRVIYVDPTGFSANSVWLDSLARSIFNAVDGANDGTAPTSSSNAFFLQTGDASAVSQAQPYRAWASGFANASKLSASGTNGELTTQTGGTVFGMDADISAQTRMGLFGGVAVSRMKVENDHQTIDTTAGYLGAYAKWTNDDYFGNVTLFGGFSEQDSERDVANNLVVGGLEQADASYSSFFISPALTVGKQLTEMPDGRPLLGSLRLHYSGMWMDGYTETGVTNPVTVDDRAIHRFGARAQLSFPEDIQAADGSTVHVNRRFGVDYAFSAGSNEVNATVVGLPLNFDADFDDEGPAGFFGADFTKTLEGGDREIRAGSEVRLTTNGSIEFRAQLSYKSTF
jgi:outer membrane autotransporter protein